ncbi:hypothetical protein HMPREF0204_14846 [Chryseobacterium gleum ATCC 35910]|uniref:Uncharacterized protein n=1 Tax=Chryseobacterium gleum ATCC 35910 TaxID=525257 RepID=A0ABP2IPQ4_CHRGE|nr:hypothetical protein HMPREF0204_14846 [Chryseobacterium gleum ATCC 35910]
MAVSFLNHKRRDLEKFGGNLEKIIELDNPLFDIDKLIQVFKVGGVFALPL